MLLFSLLNLVKKNSFSNNALKVGAGWTWSYLKQEVLLFIQEGVNNKRRAFDVRC
jgi:hypothetical protein